MPNDSGPYLTGALFCEKVLREADGVLSLIRVVDRWTVTGPLERMPLTVIQTTLVILMRSGIFRGSSQITVGPESPSGIRMPIMTFPVVFEGDDDRGVGVVGPIGFPVQEPGVYWFDVAVDGNRFTRVPLRVSYLRVGTPPQASVPT